MSPILDIEVRDEIVAARVQSIFDRLIVTSVVTVANAAVMTAVLELGHPSPGPAIWLVLVVVLAAVRIACRRLHAADPCKAERPALWARVSVAGSLLSGLLWGLGAVTLFTGDIVDQWLWILLIGGNCAGAAALHAAHLPTAMAYAIPASLPLAVALALQGSPQGMAAGTMIAAFIVVLFLTCQGFSQQFGRMLSLQIALERRSRELDEVNRRLTREIEDHRATGDALRQVQKMEALGQLTGGIAHDFNNLLTVIVGNLGMIRDRSRQQENVQRLALSALTAADRGARLTASLLAFARKQALHPTPVDLNALILDFDALLRRAAGDKVRLELDLSPGPCAANVDAAHFQSALLNLVINARDAMADGGRLTVVTGEVALTADDLVGSDAEPGSFVRVGVRDSGAGMSADVAGRAFDPFFTTKGAGKGSGLGLSQVYGFARQSGGSAVIHSRPGEGAEVSILLPTWTQAIAAPALDGLAQAPGARLGRRVLLVDDDADVLMALGEGLSHRGWDVLMAPDAEAALGLLDRYRDIGMLVTDIDMPAGMSGVDLALSARRSRPDVPALLMTGSPHAADAAPDDFEMLHKPFSADQLAEAVARRTAQHRDVSTVRIQ